MTWHIASLSLGCEEDVVAARQRARDIAAALGFDVQDQTRIATSVSEIARNAVGYATGGEVEFTLDGDARPQSLVIHISDRGPGIPDLQAILDGSYRSKTGMGKGIMGARRMMDETIIESTAAGTSVRLVKKRPRIAMTIGQSGLAPIAKSLPRTSPLDELRQQNRELLQSLEALALREVELYQLTGELESTNRGVVALHGELEATAQELRNASELKTRFLSNVSHELRTPLNSIIALSRLLLDRTDGELTAEQEKQVHFISSAATGLVELVNDLLDIAKVEVGKVDVNPSKFSVFDLFGALRGLFKPLKTNDAVELVFIEPSGVPLLYTDEAKVNQILRNFISNALKFTLAGAVTVKATYIEPDRITFGVADTGVGIAKEDQERIFEEFEQVRSVLQTRVKGTGLGLPLSRRLAELLHGSIRLESRPGAGSTFYLDIPTYWVSGGVAITETRPAAKGKPRILLADDDEAFRYVMRRMISADKYEIVEVTDGDAALASMDASPPDLVILDLHMPRRDGYSVLEEMAHNDRTRSIPVIISTSLALDERARGRLVRSHAVLSKTNLSAERISDTLATALSRESPT